VDIRPVSPIGRFLQTPVTPARPAPAEGDAVGRLRLGPEKAKITIRTSTFSTVALYRSQPREP